MKTILVTGAAGFIGSHVVEALVRRGDRVVGVDNFDPYYDPLRKRQNAEDVAEALARGVSLVEGDVRDVDLVNRLFEQHAFDAVVHLAAMAGVRASIERPALYFDVNVTGTRVLLEAAARAKVSQFVLASTSSVYGATMQIPFVETDPADRPLSPYAASKRAGEIMAYTYHELFGLSVTALRFFTVYGTRNRPDMMAYRILDSIHRGREVPLYAGGEMWRDWTYIDDIVDGVLRATDRPLGYEIFNLGRGEPVRLLDFVRTLERLTGKPALFRSADRPSTDVPKTWADLSKANRLLGYTPKVSIEEGARAVSAWYLADAARPAGERG